MNLESIFKVAIAGLFDDDLSVLVTLSSSRSNRNCLHLTSIEIQHVMHMFSEYQF